MLYAGAAEQYGGGDGHRAAGGDCNDIVGVREGYLQGSLIRHNGKAVFKRTLGVDAAIMHEIVAGLFHLICSKIGLVAEHNAVHAPLMSHVRPVFDYGRDLDVFQLQPVYHGRITYGQMNGQDIGHVDRIGMGHGAGAVTGFETDAVRAGIIENIVKCLRTGGEHTVDIPGGGDFVARHNLGAERHSLPYIDGDIVGTHCELHFGLLIFYRLGFIRAAGREIWQQQQGQSRKTDYGFHIIYSDHRILQDYMCIR